MDYEKKYKEALEMAKSLYKEADEPIRKIYEGIFPELAESEDEKIRKEIISFIVTTPKAIQNHAKWIAWLEKHNSVEWSEDDDAMLYGCIETEEYMLSVVNGRQQFDVGNEQIKEACQKELDWLKSLEKRFFPQK